MTRLVSWWCKNILSLGDWMCALLTGWTGVTWGTLYPPSFVLSLSFSLISLWFFSFYRCFVSFTLFLPFSFSSSTLFLLILFLYLSFTFSLALTFSLKCLRRTQLHIHQHFTKLTAASTISSNPSEFFSQSSRCALTAQSSLYHTFLSSHFPSSTLSPFVSLSVVYSPPLTLFCVCVSVC